MDKQIFKDRILETENLTDELEDKEANWLLNWGIGLLNQVLFDVDDEETAGENVNALMAVMRKINRICARRDSMPTEELSLELEKLSNLFAVAFNFDRLPNPTECAMVATRLAGMESTAQALEFLTRWGRRPVSRI